MRNCRLTVHVAIGTDIVHMTPKLDGAALGQASLADFRTLCDLVATMAGGVWLNLGSAVVLPEVFLKAVAIVRNLGRSLDGLTTANLDFDQKYRGLLNVLERPGSEGIALTGHHEILIPLLHAAVLARIASHWRKPIKLMRIAVFCPNLIGDTVMATPTIRAIRQGFPSRDDRRRDQAARGTDSGRNPLVRRADRVRSALGRPRATDHGGRATVASWTIRPGGLISQLVPFRPDRLDGGHPAAGRLCSPRPWNPADRPARVRPRSGQPTDSHSDRGIVSPAGAPSSAVRCDSVRTELATTTEDEVGR